MDMDIPALRLPDDDDDRTAKTPFHHYEAVTMSQHPTTADGVEHTHEGTMSEANSE